MFENRSKMELPILRLDERGPKIRQHDAPNFLSGNHFSCKFLIGQNMVDFRAILNRPTRNSTKFAKISYRSITFFVNT